MNFKRYHVSKNMAWTGWAQDYVTRINDSNKASLSDDILTFSVNAGYEDYDNKYIFATDWETSQQYTISFKYRRSTSQSSSSIFALHYTDNSTSIFPAIINDGEWHSLSFTSIIGKTIKYLTPYYSSGSVEVDINTFMVNVGSIPQPYEPYGNTWIDLTSHIMSTTWQDGSTYSRSGGSWSSSVAKKRSRKKK